MNEAKWWEWEEVNDGEIVDENEFDVLTAPSEEVWIEEDSDTHLEATSGSTSASEASQVAVTSTITLNAADVYGQQEREIRASEAAVEVGASEVALTSTITLNAADVYGQQKREIRTSEAAVEV